MALQGNPFLGKLKIPAPDLSRIPDAPFEDKGSKELLEPATKWQQTDNKPATTVSKTSNKPITNRQQSDNTSSAPITSKIGTGNKVATEPATLSATKWQQTDNKPATTTTFSALVGLQSALIVFLYQSCKAARSRCTDALTLEHLASCLGSSSGSVKTTLQRLEAKDYISRIGFKNGRGGWSKYELPDALFRELLQFETENKLATKWQQTDNKVGTKPATEPTTSVPSSSSFLDLENIKTTTTGEPDSGSTTLPSEWLALDLSPLAEIGFGQTQLKQLLQLGKLQSPEVQDSIQFFAFDLKRNGKGNTLNSPPLNFFMGILRKGIPYAPPENYESPADEARRKTREFKERKDRERQAEEQKILDLEFSEWRRGLPAAELAALLPEFARKPGPMQDSALKTHFENEVWPTRAPELLGLAKLDHVEIGRQIDKALTEVQL